LIQGTKYEF